VRRKLIIWRRRSQKSRRKPPTWRRKGYKSRRNGAGKCISAAGSLNSLAGKGHIHAGRDKMPQEAYFISRLGV